MIIGMLAKSSVRNICCLFVAEGTGRKSGEEKGGRGGGGRHTRTAPLVGGSWKDRAACTGGSSA